MPPQVQESQTKLLPEADPIDSLQDQTPDWLKSSRRLFGFVALLGIVFCFLSYRPLWHTDLWGHLSYGRLIWQSGQLPATETLMPLASGMPIVDTAWLSQLIGYAAQSRFGVPGLQFLYAASITLCAAMLLWRFHRRSQNWQWAVLGIAMFMVVNWQQFSIVRPQLAGLVCFVSLFVMLTARRQSRAVWFLVPTMFAVWANLHGSFAVGLGLLGCSLVGQAFDVLRRTGEIGSVFRSRRVRRSLMLLQLAAAAVLLNPYGLALYGEVVAFAGNGNLADLVEWKPLHLRMQQGQAAAVLALGLIFAYVFTPRRVTTFELLLLLGLGGGALWTSRLIVWWAPVASYYFVLHAAAATRRKFGRERTVTPSSRSGSWAVASAGLTWVFFAYTPFGAVVLDGHPPKEQKGLSSATPVAAVEYLKKHSPHGQLFNALEWGDYLLWEGNGELQVFVSSHVHLIPEEIWQSYMSVINIRSGWESTLERHGVNVVLIDPHRQPALADRLRDNSQWRIGFEDNRSVVFVRESRI